MRLATLSDIALGAGSALACLIAIGDTAPASAATAATLAGYSRATPISAYRNAAVWSAYDDATDRYTLTLKHGDTIRALPLAPREDEFDATVGRGAGGRVLVAYADCPTGGRCGIYGFHPEQNVSSLLHASTRRGVLPESPSVWGNRVVWVETRGELDRATVFAALTPGSRPKVLRRFAAGPSVRATALRGDVLALGLGPVDGEEQIQVQRLDTTRRRVVGHTRGGENGQTFVGLSFVGRSLYWTRICRGDPCAGVAFRYRYGRFAHARVPRHLAGFAMASSGAYWVTDQSGICDAFETGARCQVQHAALRFEPGRDPGDGP